MNELEQITLELTETHIKTLFKSLRNAENKKRFMEKLSERLASDINFNELAQDFVMALAPKFGFQEMPISKEEAQKVLGVKNITLLKYCMEGMPYIKGSPNKYLKSEILNWQKTKKGINKI